MLPKYEKMTYISDNTLIKPLFFSEKIITTIKQQLSCLDWSMFLESASEDHIDSNWSIFTAQPLATLTEVNTQVILTDKLNNTDELINLDPLAAQKLVRERLFSSEKSNRFPFTGGVIAAYHYEMGEIFESLHKQQLNLGLDLGSFHCGFYDWAILYNLKDKQYFLVQQKTRNQHHDVSDLWQSRFKWLQLLSSQTVRTKHLFTLTEDWEANYSEAQYHASFNKIQQYILSGDCYQVNLAQRFEAHYKGDEYQAYQALLQENKAPFAAFVRLPKQTIISVSLIIKYKLNLLKAQCLGI